MLRGARRRPIPSDLHGADRRDRETHLMTAAQACAALLAALVGFLPRPRPARRRRRERRRNATTAPTATRSTAPAPAPTTAASPSGSPARRRPARRRAATTPATGTVDVGKTVLLAPRTKTSGCKLGANPDRRCSPGAYYSKLTKAVICASTFRTGPIRNVPDSEKHQVEIEYGLAPKPLRVDARDRPHRLARARRLQRHRQPLPREGDAPGSPGFHVKDKLENKLHDLVCDGTMTLRSVQKQIAANWQALYKKVFGITP